MDSTESQYSDVIVYVDESGDHGMDALNPDYPIFVLAFCVFSKETYASQVAPALQRFKFQHFGHDMVILHEHEIRKTKNEFKFLFDATRRATFLGDLNELIEQADFQIIASVIDKASLKKQQPPLDNPYHLALEFCLDRLYRELSSQGQKTTYIVFESRGKKEDNELELEFRRRCDGDNYLRTRLPFQIILADKKANSSGLQLADLVARPIGLSVLRPLQPNRAYEILKPKFRKSPTGQIEGWGLKKW